MSFVRTLNSIKKIQAELIKAGLSYDQNFPRTSEEAGYKEIGFANDNLISIALSPIRYSDIYNELDSKKAFTIKLVDGALLQISYRFDRTTDKIISHRLGFFPKLDLIPWSEDEELYEKDNLFADILSGMVVHCPFRFDFNRNETAADHSKGHLTIGQIKDCRIPVSTPLSPGEFLGFIIGNLYSKAKANLPNELYTSSVDIEHFLVADDKKKFHLFAPVTE